MKYTTKSLKETLQLGKKLAPSFNSNIIGLIGDLGSGKTAFTKGMADYFGIKNITSPTFVVMKVYKVKVTLPAGRQESLKFKVKRLVHVDSYRLNNYQSLIDIGLEEYLNDPESLVLIEWADKIKEQLPKNTKYIKFKLGQKENERIIKFC
jgi:tRNA threonylcarbamoyladenosine biosynthesis protein TsaE